MSQIVATDTDDAQRLDRRRDRYNASYLLLGISELSRVRGCRKVGVLTDGGAAIKVTTAPDGTRRAGFAGLATCGSVWACPLCAEKILAGRKEEMEAALAAWTETGGAVGMITLTMRHRADQTLTDLWDALTTAWAKVTSGRSWVADQTRWGAPVERVVRQGHRKGQTVTENRVGWIKAVEVTHGRAGWHVHVHVAVLLPAGVTARDVDDLACSMFDRWRSSLQRSGLQAPLARHGGLDAKLWDGQTGMMAEYYTKNTYRSNAAQAAMELTRSDLKAGRKSNRTPFQILADIAGHHLADDGDLWRDFERVSKGRRQMSWSVGLRDRLIPDVAEQTDQQLADASIDGETVAALTRQGVKAMRRQRLHATLLEAAEAGYGPLQTVMLHYGVDFQQVAADTVRDTRRTLIARHDGRNVKDDRRPRGRRPSGPLSHRHHSGLNSELYGQSA